MIDHTGIKVQDFARSKVFYTEVLGTVGCVLKLELEDAAGFGDAHAGGGGEDPGGDFWITEGIPYVPRTHIAFRATTRAQVDAFYITALAAGGTDNGAPGLRPQYHAGYYAAFVLDPDGYNIEAVFHGA
ncbi:MAG: VOC family protein [Rhodocyclaceae bacterium]